jgi:hypothetical protein
MVAFSEAVDSRRIKTTGLCIKKAQRTATSFHKSATRMRLLARRLPARGLARSDANRIETGSKPDAKPTCRGTATASASLQSAKGDDSRMAAISLPRVRPPRRFGTLDGYLMDQAAHNKIVSFIWGIADDVLRDLFVRGKYRDVILPMCVLRRLDAVLEPTKDKVRDTKAMLDKAGITEQRQALCSAAGQAFYNTSPFTLRDLKSRANARDQSTAQ